MASLPVLLLILLVPTTSLPVADSNDNVGFQLKLTHVDAGTSYTKPQLLSRAIARSKARVAALQSAATTAVSAAAPAPAPAAMDPITAARVLVTASSGEYLVDLAIGTPPLPYTAIMDTGSDLIWTQCAPCLLCADQPTPFFDAKKSATFRALPCRPSSPQCAALSSSSCFKKMCVYQYYYGDAASTAGVLANETFTFGAGAAGSTKDIKADNVSFGCSSLNAGDLANSSGKVGFGRGPLSLVSQLGTSRFSYCLTSYLSPAPSRLYFGAYANLNITTNITGAGSPSPVQSTPFVVNPALPSMYFLSVRGISLGTKRLPIDPQVFAINGDGTGGVIIDSGTSITWLQQDAYDAVRRGLASAIPLPATNDTDDTGLDTCFQWPPPPNVTVTVPNFVFHFDGGANMTLPPENYMVVASTTGFLCLAMAATRVGTIIGNYQQQNMHLLYDIANSLMSFVPALCDII